MTFLTFRAALHNEERRKELLSRTQEYFQLGGLFNPELMDPKTVQALLYDLREYLLAEDKDAKNP